MVILRDFLFQNFNTLRTLRKIDSHGKHMVYDNVNERQFSFFKSNLQYMDLSTFGVALQNMICLPIFFTRLIETNTNSMNYFFYYYFAFL